MHTPRSFDHRLWPSLLHTIHTPSILFKDYVNLSQSKSPTGRAISIHEIWDQSRRLLRSRCRKNEFLLQVGIKQASIWVCMFLKALKVAMSVACWTVQHSSEQGTLHRPPPKLRDIQGLPWPKNQTLFCWHIDSDINDGSGSHEWWWMICLALDTIHREIHRDSLTRYLKPKRCFLFSLETAKPPSWRMQAILSSGDTNANVANAPDLE